MAVTGADYLIIGAGAVGLAFADTLLTETDARLAIVDRRGGPGGHWNDAYSFVALHQPSAFYGVNSTPLGTGRKDERGVNAGLYELASRAEVIAYFETVMRRLLLSGRVDFLPMTDHRGGGLCVSLLSGAETRIDVRRRIVDGTFFGTTVPATHTPKFRVGEGVRLVPPNALPHLARTRPTTPDRFVILGAGKTAMDVGVWLLSSGAPPERITWVMPRDSWLLNRLNTQPGMEFFDNAIGGQALQMEACAQAVSVDDLFDRLETAGVMLRIDRNVRPGMFHYATIAPGEVEALGQIRDVVRLGRVLSIDVAGMRLEQGSVASGADTLYIDCTASAVEKRDAEPVFQPGRIVVQLVRAPQPSFSAALIAYIEAHGRDDEERNALCAPVPFPDTPEQFPHSVIGNFANERSWASRPELREWIRASRLDGFGKIAAAVPPDDQEKQATIARIRANMAPAVQNLSRLLNA